MIQFPNSFVEAGEPRPVRLKKRRAAVALFDTAPMFVGERLRNDNLVDRLKARAAL